MVVVDADAALRAEATELRFSVVRVPSGELVTERVVPRGDLRWPIVFALVPAGDAARRFRVRAEAHSDARRLAFAETESGYVAQRTLELRLVLRPDCAGSCSPALVEPDTLPAYPAPEVDGGPADAGPGDAQPDAPAAECEADEDCDDGLACNGVETCVDDVCRVGTPVACAISEDACVELVCDVAAGLDCEPRAREGDCDDDDPCTVETRCVDGVCAGRELACDDGRVCEGGECVCPTDRPVACPDGCFATCCPGARRSPAERCGWCGYRTCNGTGTGFTACSDQNQAGSNCCLGGCGGDPAPTCPGGQRSECGPRVSDPTSCAWSGCF